MPALITTKTAINLENNQMILVKNNQNIPAPEPDSIPDSCSPDSSSPDVRSLPDDTSPEAGRSIPGKSSPEADSIPDEPSPETGSIPDESSPEADSIQDKLCKIKLRIAVNNQYIKAVINQSGY